MSNVRLVDSDVTMHGKQKTSSEPVFNASECVANTSCAGIITGAMELNETTESCAPKVITKILITVKVLGQIGRVNSKIMN